MSKYLDRLNLRKGVPPSVPKLPKGWEWGNTGASGTFGTDPGTPFEKTHVSTNGGEAPVPESSSDGGTPLAGLPLDPDSAAPFCPWIAPMTADEFDRRRNEVVGMIEEIAEIEGWDREALDDVLSRAIRGPVGDLRPNWHYFRQRLNDLRRAG